MHAVMASHGPARAASPAGVVHCSCVGAVDVAPQQPWVVGFKCSVGPGTAGARVWAKLYVPSCGG